MLFAITQFFGGSITWLLLKTFTRFELNGVQYLRAVRRPFIVAANHESRIDPPLIGVALMYRLSLLPTRFMAKDQLFLIPGFNIIIWAMGAFRARKKTGIGRALLTPVKILEKGGALVMFPEAHIVPERGKLGSGRRGTAILALTTRAQILPMALHTPESLEHLPLWRFFLTRPRITVTIGEPFYLNNTDFMDLSDANTTAATAVIMGKIGELYNQFQY